MRGRVLIRFLGRRERFRDIVHTGLSIGWSLGALDWVLWIEIEETRQPTDGR